MIRLYIDEFGHSNMKSSDRSGERYLGLTGVIMRLSTADGPFTDGLNQIKDEIFQSRDFCLHRREIIDADTPPFHVLSDPAVRARFNAALLDIMENTSFRVVTVIIDKKEHRDRYQVWHFDPYHYCMTVLLERYVMMLERNNSVGDVMAESREKKDNKRLSRAYSYVYRNGTDNIRASRFQQWLSSKEIKIKRKADNIAGLQLADMIANPSCRDLICRRTKQPMTADFGSQVVEMLYRKKYRRNPRGKIVGWGTKWLPV